MFSTSHYFVEASKVDRYEQLATRDAIKGGLGWATKARDILETRQEIVEGVFDHEDIPFGKGGWPKTIIERFKALDREFKYCEIYASLSSQVHNDADALVDFIMVTVTEQARQAHELMEDRAQFGKLVLLLHWSLSLFHQKNLEC